MARTSVRVTPHFFQYLITTNHYNVCLSSLPLSRTITHPQLLIRFPSLPINRLSLYCVAAPHQKPASQRNSLSTGTQTVMVYIILTGQAPPTGIPNSQAKAKRQCSEEVFEPTVFKRIPTSTQPASCSLPLSGLRFRSFHTAHSEHTLSSVHGFPLYFIRSRVQRSCVSPKPSEPKLHTVVPFFRKGLKKCLCV